MPSTLQELKLERLHLLRELQLQAERQRAETQRTRWATPGAMTAELDRSYVHTAALDAVDRALVDLFDDPGAPDRLMVFIAPQEGKSQKVSRRTPAWLLARDPTLRIAVVSFEQERAVRWGREIKRDVATHPQLNITLREDSRAAGRWHTRQGGGVYCVGIGGALTGEPVDVLIIDDPVKDRRAAESALQRDQAWDWWESVGQMRLSPRARVVLMMTRWHADDLAGRVLGHEPHLWRVLSIPAIAEPGDPLGRAPGEELVSARGRAPGYFTALQVRLSGYVWRALFQQRPTAAGGTLFARDGWRFWNWSRWPDLLSLDGRNVDLRDCWRFLTVDLAASRRTSADWTVAAAWALTMDRQLICLGRVRDRCEEGGHWALISPLAAEWRAPDVGVESTMMGTTLVRQAVRAGLAPFDLHADTDKVTRAIPAGHMVRQGQVWLPHGADWLDDAISEAADFPTGAHDDWVDVVSYAAKLAHGWHPSGQRGAAARPDVDPFDRQMSQALGHGPNGHDPLDNI